MISVVCLTYQRHHLLEEAMYSFLNQDYEGESEMVIVNDSEDVEYVYDHPKIRIYNLKTRFSSVGKKLEWGMKKCKGDYVYRLDDDDLIAKWGLNTIQSHIDNNKGYNVYRCKHHYFFEENEFKGLSSSVNNGNCYTKKYVNEIEFPDKSIGEDGDITLHTKVYSGDLGRYNMIYRWGMNTYHISGMGNLHNEKIYRITDRSNKESGVITLDPKFNDDYWSKI
jgi:hypothetical protein